jgi:hypothetical protein
MNRLVLGRRTRPHTSPNREQGFSLATNRHGVDRQTRHKRCNQTCGSATVDRLDSASPVKNGDMRNSLN